MRPSEILTTSEVRRRYFRVLLCHFDPVLRGLRDMGRRADEVQWDWPAR